MKEDVDKVDPARWETPADVEIAAQPDEKDDPHGRVDRGAKLL